MISGRIKFSEPNDVLQFIKAVSKIDADVDVMYNTMILDGKSLGGVMSIQLGKELKCTIHDNIDNCKDIIDKIKEYIVVDFS